MCGVVGIAGVNGEEPVSALTCEALLLLQHRGQDACGIISMNGSRLAMHKGFGLVSENFKPHHVDALSGEFAVGHVRYPTAGKATALNEIQPFYVNSPFGMSMVHNGNLTNCTELREALSKEAHRHINSDSDSEILLNIFAYELTRALKNGQINSQVILHAVDNLHKRCKGAYSVCVLIANYGLIAFRDPNGIRPLVLGKKETATGTSYMVASESVALINLGYELVRDVLPGEVVIVDQTFRLLEPSSVSRETGHPCLFEYVYLARPDSMVEKALVYETRINMGSQLARQIRKRHNGLEIDVVIPIPDSARPTAMQLAQELCIPYREGFVKNRYIGRTFIMPDPAMRRRSVRRKLSVIPSEFSGKRVLLVDDSIVRGTTGREIVQMAREAEPKAIHFASAAPPVRYQNVYGIDMPNRKELIAAERNDQEIGTWLGVDQMIYQEIDSLVEAVRSANPSLSNAEASCFTGEYLKGTVSDEYLTWLERTSTGRLGRAVSMGQMDLALSVVT